jgi:hypothetical protein
MIDLLVFLSLPLLFSLFFCTEFKLFFVVGGSGELAKAKRKERPPKEKNDAPAAPPRRSSRARKEIYPSKEVCEKKKKFLSLLFLSSLRYLSSPLLPSPPLLICLPEIRKGSLLVRTRLSLFFSVSPPHISENCLLMFLFFLGLR